MNKIGTVCVVVLAVALSLAAACFSQMKEVKAAESFARTEIRVGGTYTVETEGDAFFIGFSRRGDSFTSGQVASVCYVITDIEVDPAAEGEYAAFCQPGDLSGGVDASFRNVIGSTVSANDCTEGVIYNLLFFKSGTSAQANAIMRKGYNQYTQLSYGLFNDTSDSRYGLYYDGIPLKMTILVISVYSADAAIYSSEGVTVTAVDGDADADISAENAEVYLTDKTDPDFPYLVNRAVIGEGYSFIPYAVMQSESETVSYVLDSITVNGEDRTSDFGVYEDGNIAFAVGPVSNGASVNIRYRQRVVSFDEVTVHDLIDVSGKPLIEFNELRDPSVVVGSIPNRPNNSFRFILNIPSGSWASKGATSIIKFGLFGNNNVMSSNQGYNIGFYAGRIRIASGVEEEFANVADERVANGARLLVEMGLKKGYDENGRYIFDRVFVKINGELVVYYDDYARQPLGSNIVGPLLLDESAYCSIENAGTLYEVSVQSVPEGLSVYGCGFIEEGEDCNIVFFESEGLRITAVYVNGEDVTAQISVEQNRKILVLENIAQDAEITLYYEENVQCQVETMPGEDCRISAPSQILYGDTAEFVFTANAGKVISSVFVNEEDVTSNLSREGGKYILRIRATENLSVACTAQEKNFAVTVVQTSGVSVQAPKNVAAGSTLEFTVLPAEGYKITSVTVNGEAAARTQTGWAVQGVYEDAEIRIAAEQTSVPADDEESGCTNTISGMSVIPTAIAVAVALVLLVRKDKRYDSDKKEKKN